MGKFKIIHRGQRSRGMSNDQLCKKQMKLQEKVISIETFYFLQLFSEIFVNPQKKIVEMRPW